MDYLTPHTAGGAAAALYNSPNAGRLWLEQAGSRDAEMTKAAQMSGALIVRDRVREAPFIEKVIPTETVNSADPRFQRNTENDALAIMVDVEPGGPPAMTIAPRATPKAMLVSGSRFLVHFWTIASSKVEVDQRTLPAYHFPITKVIEDKALKSMMEVKDRTLLTHSESCIEFMQTRMNGSVTALNVTGVNAGTVREASKFKGERAKQRNIDDFEVQPLTSQDVVKAAGTFIRYQTSSSGTAMRLGGMHAHIGLMNEYDYRLTSATTADQVGYSAQEKHWFQGAQGSTLGGVQFILSIKGEIVREGNIYLFTAPDYLGKSFLWNDIQFWIEAAPSKTSWWAWMDIGMVLANVASIIKIELYGGSVILDAEDDGYEVAVPLAESEIGVGTNHKIDEGGLSSYVRV